MTEPTWMRDESAYGDSACYVYYLADGRTSRWPRYVGSTADQLTRLSSHRKPTEGAIRSGFRAWKAGVMRDGGRIVMRVVSVHPTIEEARAAEWRTINRWKRRGLCDLNSGIEGRGEQWELRRRGVR